LKWLQSVVWLGLLLAAIVVQVGIIRTTSAWTVAPHLPFWADQVQYLTETYRGYEMMRDRGLLVGTIDAIRQPRPQGWLLQTAASLYMQVVGPSRLAALDVHLALLVVWLGVTGYAIRRTFGSVASVLAIGLILSAGTLTIGPGGPYDFRLDFAAACLWGSLVALVAAAYGRVSWGLYAAIVLVGIVLIITRFISSFYLMPFGALVTLLSILMCWRSECSWGRLWSWTIPVVAVWTLTFGVVLWLSFDQFSGYYIRGHVVSDEASVRRAGMGLLTFADDIVFYPRLLRDPHLGTTFIWLACAVLAASLLAAVAVRLLSPWARTRTGSAMRPWLDATFHGPENTDGQRAGRLWWFLLVAAIGFLSPYLVLTVSRDKNLPVAGVLVPPIILLVVGLAVGLAWLSGRTLSDAHRLGQSLKLGGLALGVVVAVVGLNAQWQRVQSGPFGLPSATTLQGYDQLVDDALPYIAQMNGEPISWSLDGHYVELSYSTIEVLMFERTGHWVNLTGGLGYGAIEQKLDAAELRKAAESSDVLILAKYPPGTKMQYPYDQSIFDQHEILESYAHERLTLLGTYDLNGVQFLLYIRPPSEIRTGDRRAPLLQVQARSDVLDVPVVSPPA
jgi:hypothetical protein